MHSIFTMASKSPEDGSQNPIGASLHIEIATLPMKSSRSATNPTSLEQYRGFALQISAQI